MQDEAVKAAQKSVTLTTNQYKAGTVSYLNVSPRRRRADQRDDRGPDPRPADEAAVLLVKALGGGWNAANLPSATELTAQAALTSSAGLNRAR